MPKFSHKKESTFLKYIRITNEEAWYDNEFGYTKQVIRLAKQIAKVRRLTYY